MSGDDYTESWRREQKRLRAARKIRRASAFSKTADRLRAAGFHVWHHDEQGKYVFSNAVTGKRYAYLAASDTAYVYATGAVPARRLPNGKAWITEHLLGGHANSKKAKAKQSAGPLGKCGASRESCEAYAAMGGAACDTSRRKNVRPEDAIVCMHYQKPEGGKKPEKKKKQAKKK